MTEMSKSGPKQCPSEKVDCRTLFPIIDSSVSCDSVAVNKQFHLDNTCFGRKLHCNTINYQINKLIENLAVSINNRQMTQP